VSCLQNDAANLSASGADDFPGLATCGGNDVQPQGCEICPTLAIVVEQMRDVQ
jgi:hypothetical protein